MRLKPLRRKCVCVVVEVASHLEALPMLLLPPFRTPLGLIQCGSGGPTSGVVGSGGGVACRGLTAAVAAVTISDAVVVDPV
jgi:hypothetical protein